MKKPGFDFCPEDMECWEEISMEERIDIFMKRDGNYMAGMVDRTNKGQMADLFIAMEYARVPTHKLPGMVWDEQQALTFS